MEQPPRSITRRSPGESWEYGYRDRVRRIEQGSSAHWVAEPELEVARRSSESSQAMLCIGVVVLVGGDVSRGLDQCTADDVAVDAHPAIAERELVATEKPK